MVALSTPFFSIVLGFYSWYLKSGLSENGYVRFDIKSKTIYDAENKGPDF